MFVYNNKILSFCFIILSRERESFGISQKVRDITILNVYKNFLHYEKFVFKKKRSAKCIYLLQNTADLYCTSLTLLDIASLEKIFVKMIFQNNYV